MIDEHLLSQIALVRGLNAEARREIAARSALLRKNAGEVLWRAGDPARGLVVLLSGKVRVLRASRDGRRHVVHREGAGAVLGEVPLLDGGVYPATAEVELPVTALLVTAEALDAAMAADARLGRILLAGLARRVRQLVERLDSLAVLDVRARLARHLLARADLAGGGTFDLGASQSSLAEDLGTVREVVVRHLGALRRRGVLAAEGRGRYRVLDRTWLAALAER